MDRNGLAGRSVTRCLIGILVALSWGVPAVCAQPNALSVEEQNAGWRLLFDGQSTAGWRGYKSTTMPASWRVENGSLLARREEGKSAGDIVTVEQYGDFELSLEWKMT